MSPEKPSPTVKDASLIKADIALIIYECKCKYLESILMGTSYAFRQAEVSPDTLISLVTGGLGLFYIFILPICLNSGLQDRTQVLSCIVGAEYNWKITDCTHGNYATITSAGLSC